MKYKLDDVCIFINGGAWSDKEYVNKGLPVLKVTNCKSKGFELDDIDYLPISSSQLYAKNKLVKGDVVIATVGSHPNLVDSTAGRSCIVSSIVEGFYLNQNAVCIRTKDSNILDQKYLGYLTKYRLFQHYIQMRGKGAANQMRIAIGAIKSFEFDFPDIETQRRIGNILSSYDALIEINQRQIKLLEEAAQRLYKEWFVNLRFPGYEDAQIVDGIPDRWNIGTLGDIAIDVGERERKENRSKYKYYLPIDCLPKKSLSYQQMNDISLAESSLIAFDSGDILFGAMRPYFHKVVIARDNGLTRSTCFVVNSQQESKWAYLTMLLFDDKTIDYATQISVGTTMPYVRWKDFVKMPILVPPNGICKGFSMLTKPILQKANLLAESVIMLTEARDRLLPKLMSGEIEL